MTGVQIITGDALEALSSLPADSVDMCVTSPPYWGLRDYGTADWIGGDPDCTHERVGTTRTPWANSVKGPAGKDGKNGERYSNMTKVVGGVCAKCGAEWVDRQYGLEPTLGDHLDVMVRVFREVRRVLRPHGSVWLNYGDCYATQPNGRSAAATKAAGTDDRTFRDKPFSTVGPIYAPDRPSTAERGLNSTAKSAAKPAGRVMAGGTLKPKDLCMVPNRLAIALQDDGWWVRSEIVWGKPNGMPDSSGRYRPATAHEKVWLLSKSADMYYDAEAVRQHRASPDHRRHVDCQYQAPGSRAHTGLRQAGLQKSDKQRGHSRRHAGFKDRWDGMSRAEQQANGRLLRNYEPAPPVVWHISTRGYSAAHFATFPPELVVPMIAAGCPPGGVVLDPFFGAGTVGLVAQRMGRDCIGIELNPDYVEMARCRLKADRADAAVTTDTPERAPGADTPLFGAPP